MTALTNEELLQLCDACIAQVDTEFCGAYPHRAAEHVGNIARALKSRLQAEAPEDAEVAAIEKRHADCEGFYAGHGGYRPDWHKDRATLLAKLRARTQAEAQAPTTAAQASVMTEEELEAVGWMKLAHNSFTSAERRRRCWILSSLIDRLTGAPAPAPTIDPASSPGVQPISGAPHNSGSSPGVLHNNPDTTAPATAPKHAPNCGYWLDLNCSCKLEDNTP